MRLNSFKLPYLPNLFISICNYFNRNGLLLLASLSHLHITFLHHLYSYYPTIQTQNETFLSNITFEFLTCPSSTRPSEVLRKQVIKICFSYAVFRRALAYSKFCVLGEENTLELFQYTVTLSCPLVEPCTMCEAGLPNKYLASLMWAMHWTQQKLSMLDCSSYGSPCHHSWYAHRTSGPLSASLAFRCHTLYPGTYHHIHGVHQITNIVLPTLFSRVPPCKASHTNFLAVKSWLHYLNSHCTAWLHQCRGCIQRLQAFFTLQSSYCKGVATSDRNMSSPVATNSATAYHVSDRFVTAVDYLVLPVVQQFLKLLNFHYTQKYPCSFHELLLRTQYRLVD